MASPSVSRTQTSDLADPSEDLAIIPQAFAYHRMLGTTSGLGYDYDESDDEEDPWDNEESERYPDESYPSTDAVPVFTVKLHDRLLSRAAPGYRNFNDERLVCTNAALRPGLWMVEPNLGLSNPELDMGFLSQLAQICVHADINECRRDLCLQMKKVMDGIAPPCDWVAFREWALVTMSCQAAMSTKEKQSKAHTHIATAVSSLCKIIKNCHLSARASHLFRPFLDGESMSSIRASIDVAQVSNIIYWMTKIQSQIGVGPMRFGRWNPNFLPSEVTLPWIERALHEMEDFGLCRNRLWNLIGVSDRKSSDLPDIISALKANNSTLDHDGHTLCTPSKCQEAFRDSTSVQQLHKCDKKDCELKHFPVEFLETALEMGNSTAWLCKDAKLRSPQDDYIAISHVWSDGTGVGVRDSKDKGKVNSCLFNYFADIAVQLCCTAVWWDTLSIPSDSKARSKALNMMHSNYANARYTVVHDNGLLNFPWSDDGSPCLALVLSTWFTRGWTALELSMSKRVKVLFGNPVKGKPPLIKDLDQDILAKSPGFTSRAHWLATTLVRRLRQRIDDVGDLLAILSCRSTSWVRDRTIIASLLAGVPDFDSTLGESVMTTKILQFLGKVPYFCLLHGKPTMSNKGPWSWCAATLDDMPIDTSADLGGNKSEALLEVDESGAACGDWYCHTVDSSSVKRLKAFGNDLAAVVKVDVALTHWERCLLLQPSSGRHEPLSLLVIPLAARTEDRILECRYIGTVVEDRGGFEEDSEHRRQRPVRIKIRLGTKEAEYTEGMQANDAVSEMTGYQLSGLDSSDESTYGPVQPAEGQLVLAKVPPKWLSFSRSLDDYRNLRPFAAEPEANMGDKVLQLITALLTRNENARLYLVKNGVSLGAWLMVYIFQQLSVGGVAERACASMKMLGDVYFKSSKLQDALPVYGFVHQRYQENKGSFSNPLRPLQLNYALGTTFARASRQLGDNLLRIKYNISAGTHVKQAEKLFRDTLRECEQRAEALGEIKMPMQNPAQKARESSGHVLWRTTGTSQDFKSQSAQALTTLNSGSGVPPSAMGHSGEDHTDEKARRAARDAQKWHQLELNVIADLTLLLTGNEDLDGAAKTFQKAFRKFGSLPDETVEGFNLQLPERDQLDFESKNERDKQVADIYQRALKRFGTMFHGDHLLILLTSLALGVNHLFRMKFSTAETHLMRALKGFISHLCPADDGGPALYRTNCDDEHLVIGLTRYYLGVLFWNQNKFEEAEQQLKKARKIASRYEGVEGETLKLSAIYELGVVFFHKLKIEGKRDDIFVNAKKSFETVIQHTEKWSEYDASIKPRFKADVQRLSFLSQGKMVQLHLHRDDPTLDGMIEDLKKNLHDYEVDKGDDAKTEAGFRKASDVAECEARLILGRAYIKKGEYDSAIKELDMARRGYEYLYGEHHLQTLDAIMLSADVLIHLHEDEDAEQEQAEKMLERALTNFDQTVGSHHHETLTACLKLGQVYYFRRRLDDAEKICERAHHGFKTSHGDGHRMTAQAAQLLGKIYFEKGMLGKAEKMYSKAYRAFLVTFNRAMGRTTDEFSSVSHETEPAPVITDKDTLNAAMELAMTCALMPTTITRNEAVKLFRRAMEGFSESSNQSSHQAEHLLACMRLGALYGDLNRFEEGNVLIDKARDGFRQLLEISSANNYPRSTVNSLTEYLLEAELKLAQLKLNEYKGEKKHAFARSKVNIQQVVTTIHETRTRLSKLLGETNMLTLEASTTLGNLYLEGLNGHNNSSSEGLRILLDVLNHYEPVGKAKLALGHPKRLRIMDSLISYYHQTGQLKSVDDWNTRLWEELSDAHGADKAVLIMDAMNGPKHTVRNIKYTQALFGGSWRESGAIPESSSSRGLGSAVDEFLDFSTTPILSSMPSLPGFDTTMSLVVGAGDMVSHTTNQVTTTAGNLVLDTTDAIVMGAGGLLKGTGNVMTGTGNVVTEVGRSLHDTESLVDGVETMVTGADNMLGSMFSATQSSLLSRGIGVRTLGKVEPRVATREIVVDEYPKQRPQRQSGGLFGPSWGF